MSFSNTGPTTTDIATVRTAHAISLTDTCNIQRATETVSTTTRGITKTWANVYTNVACRLMATRNTGHQREEVVAETEEGVVEFILILPFATDITRDDRVVLSTFTLEIVGIDVPKTRAISQHALCRRVATT